jgi:hypothetical protein
VADAHPRRNGGDAPDGVNDQARRPARPSALDVLVESTALDRADRCAIAPRVQRAAPALACLFGPLPTCGFAYQEHIPMQTTNAIDTTKVIYGVNELDLELAGKPVSEIWKRLEQVFNIPRDAVVTVNGTRTDDTYVVAAGDELEFTKAAGVKGNAA